MRAANIHSLPDELLGLIFSHCVQDATHIKPFCAPLLVTHVCSRWRQTAFAYPPLWSKIILNRENLKSKGIENLIAMWLQLSKRCLLDVYFDVHCGHWLDLAVWEELKWSIDLCQRLAGMLAPHCPRFRSLKGTFHECIAPMLSFSQMKSLEVLDILDESQDTETDNYDFSTPLPHLHTIILRRVFLGEKVQTLCAQKQVTHLEAALLTVSDACMLLGALPALEIASFSLFHTAEDDDLGNRTATTWRRVYVPTLTHLHIACHRLSPSTLLNRLATPNLSSLHLENFGHPHSFWMALRAFVGSGPFWDSESESGGGWAASGFVTGEGGGLAGTRLETLKLHISDGPFNRLHANALLLDVLQNTPQLRALSCSGSFLNGEILRALTWNGYTPERTLIPRLERVEVWVCRDFEVEAFGRLVRSRAHRVKGGWRCGIVSG